MSTMYADMAIDAVQNAKLEVVRHLVKDEQIKKPLEHFVEAQRVYTKAVTKSVMDVATVVVETTNRFFFGSAK